MERTKPRPPRSSCRTGWRNDRLRWNQGQRLIAAFLAVLLSLPWSVATGRAAGPVALIGGGRENWYPGSWSEAPARWLMDRAGPGPIVVVSTVPRDDRLPGYFRHLGAVAADDLLIARRWQAEDPAVLGRLQAAGAIVLADDDGWRSTTLLRDTTALRVIREAHLAGRPVAAWGESAAWLGALMIASGSQPLTASAALRDPWCPEAGFSQPLLRTEPLFRFGVNIVVEPHFNRRGRLLRALPMMARWREESGNLPLVVLGVDDQTALLINDQGHATVSGEGSITMLTATASSSHRVRRGEPPVLTHVRHDQFGDGFVFNLDTVAMVGIPASADSAFARVPWPAVWPAANLDGASDTIDSAGEWRVANLEADALAVELGLLTLTPGRQALPATVVIGRVAGDESLLGNRLGGLWWALARHPGALGLGLDRGAALEVTAPEGTMAPWPMKSQPAMLFVDSRRVWLRDCSHWRSLPGSVGCRQSVTLLGLVDHLLASRCRFIAASGKVTIAP